VIGVGVDVVDIERFRAVLDRRPSMAERLFTDAELAYSRSARDPVPRLASRFAAKEAVMKALGVGLGAFGWHEVEVTREPSGTPGLRLTGGAAALAEGKGVGMWHITLSHSALVAIAVALADL
jgi:holo-[acyl-carrier protein] synthase